MCSAFVQKAPYQPVERFDTDEIAFRVKYRPAERRQKPPRLGAEPDNPPERGGRPRSGRPEPGGRVGVADPCRAHSYHS